MKKHKKILKFLKQKKKDELKTCKLYEKNNYDEILVLSAWTRYYEACNTYEFVKRIVNGVEIE